MQKFRDFFSTSEGWGALVASTLGFFVASGLIDDSLAKVATDILKVLIVIIFAGVAKKTVKAGAVPFKP